MVLYHLVNKEKRKEKKRSIYFKDTRESPGTQGPKGCAENHIRIPEALPECLSANMSAPASGFSVLRADDSCLHQGDSPSPFSPLAVILPQFQTPGRERTQLVWAWSNQLCWGLGRVT